MTLRQVIDKVDRLKPNQYEGSDKVSWLSTLDGLCLEEVIKTHEPPPGEEIPDNVSYSFPDDLDETLLIVEPYGEDVYTYWLQAMIDKHNGEIDRYNQNITMFNAAYQRFCDWYNRRNMPVKRVNRFLF